MSTLGRVVRFLGYGIRQSGQLLDRLGSRLQGDLALHEHLSRHQTFMKMQEKFPNVPPNAFVAPSASIIGDVEIGTRSSIWYGCVLRGDVNSIKVGFDTNIQENTIVHVAKTNISGNVLPTVIGNKVTIGHNAVLHGCTIEDEALIGMGATLLDGVYVEKNAMVAAGSLVKQNSRIPSGEVWAGNPAKLLRKLTPEEIAFFVLNADNYTELAAAHSEENKKTYYEIEEDKIRRKLWAVQSPDYDSQVGVSRENPPYLGLPYEKAPRYYGLAEKFVSKAQQ